MMRKLAATAVAALFVLGTATSGLCADVAGTVSDSKGNPVPGVKITAQIPNGKAVGEALVDANGKYRINGLAPGTYDYALNPLQTGFKGGTAVSYLGSKGLTINWKLSPKAPAIALAMEGMGVPLAGDPFGYSAGEFASLVALAVSGVAGGVVGGYAAAGGFSSSGGSGSPLTGGSSESSAL